MITVVLRGGLGNQMFQYAAGRVLALARNTDLVLDTTYINDRFPRREFIPRTYDLDVFSLIPRFTTLSAASEKFPVPGLWLGLDIALIGARNYLGIRALIKEKKEFSFDPSVRTAGGNAELWGRWQSPKYFEDHADTIRSDFSFRHPLVGKAEDLAQKIRQENSVAIHVRRGDYVAFKKVQALMGHTDAAYYADAIRYIGDRVLRPSFFIFSPDDPGWFAEHVKFPFPATYIGSDIAGPKFSSYLELMSLCKHQIIANSTFSWWGAWLNRNPEKIVVAPALWQRDVLTGETDLLPPGWVVA